MAHGFKSGGRAKGTPNKVTTVFKDAVRTVYEDIGGHAAFAEWARSNPTDFYKIASRLIPTEAPIVPDEDRYITVSITGALPVQSDRMPLNSSLEVIDLH
jgi:hypothetical protein